MQYNKSVPRKKGSRNATRKDSVMIALRVDRAAAITLDRVAAQFGSKTQALETLIYIGSARIAELAPTETP